MTKSQKLRFIQPLMALPALLACSIAVAASDSVSERIADRARQLTFDVFGEVQIQNIAPGPKGTGITVISFSPIEDNSAQMEAYMLPDGKHLAIGQLMTKEGIQRQSTQPPAIEAVQSPQAQTTTQLPPYIAANPNVSNGEVMDIATLSGDKRKDVEEYTLKNSEIRPSIIEGAGSKILYVYFDPFCPACHQLLNTTSASVLADLDMQIHWIPVHILTQIEVGKTFAAALNFMARQGRNEEGLKLMRALASQTQSASINPLDYRIYASSDLDQVDKNNLFIANFSTDGFVRTPYLIFEKSDESVSVRHGTPSPEELEQLSQVLKVKATPHT